MRRWKLPGERIMRWSIVTIAGNVFCTKCGTAANSGASFCAKCGAPTPTSAAQSSIVEPTNQPVAQNPAMGPRWRQGPDGVWQYQGDDGYWYVGGDSAQTPPSAAMSAATAPPPAATAPAATPQRKRKVFPFIAIAGGILIAVGAFLPWLSISGQGSTQTWNAFNLNPGPNNIPVGGSSWWFGGLLVFLGIFVVAWTVFIIFMKPKPALRRRFIFRLLDRLFIPIAILCGWFLYYAHTNISNAINDVTQGNSGSFAFGYWIVAVGGTFNSCLRLLFRPWRTVREHR